MPNAPATWKPRKAKRRSSGQRGYDANWQRLRAMQLNQEPYCRMCKAKGITTAATIADHKIPIEVRPDLRLDLSNLQSLCKRCHDSDKHKEDNEKYGQPR